MNSPEAEQFSETNSCQTTSFSANVLFLWTWTKRVCVQTHAETHTHLVLTNHCVRAALEMPPSDVSELIFVFFCIFYSEILY